MPLWQDIRRLTELHLLEPQSNGRGARGFTKYLADSCKHHFFMDGAVLDPIDAEDQAVALGEEVVLVEVEA